MRAILPAALAAFLLPANGFDSGQYTQTDTAMRAWSRRRSARLPCLSTADCTPVDDAEADGSHAVRQNGEWKGAARCARRGAEPRGLRGGLALASPLPLLLARRQRLAFG
jgi:hypothetical protein